MDEVPLLRDSPTTWTRCLRIWRFFQPLLHDCRARSLQDAAEAHRVADKKIVEKRELLARSKGKHTAREARYLLAVEARKEMEQAAVLYREQQLSLNRDRHLEAVLEMSRQEHEKAEEKRLKLAQRASMLKDEDEDDDELNQKVVI